MKSFCLLGSKNKDRHHLCAAPSGPFRQMVPVPFSHDNGVFPCCARAAVGCGLTLLAGLVLMNVSCRRGPDRVRPPWIDATKAGQLALEMYDADKDGRLTGTELDKCPGLKAACTRSVRMPATVDPEGAGVTAEMITARIRAWQDSQLGRMSLRCTVKHNGRALDRATVELCPSRSSKQPANKWRRRPAPPIQTGSRC